MAQTQRKKARISKSLIAIRLGSVVVKTEEKAKVVAAVWGDAELIHFLAALAIFHMDDLKKSMMNLSYSSNHPGSIHPIPHVSLVQFILFFKSSLV